MDKFTFGECKFCKQQKALKNDVCGKCANKSDLDMFKDIFNFKDGNNDKSSFDEYFRR